MLRIIADDAIPWLREAFAELGRVTPLPGTAIDARAVADADLLLTRSVTRVDEALLRASNLRFVGSATSGIDHVDLAALRRRGIAFAHAPGGNANAVVEYVLTALALATERHPQCGEGPIGVVGYGEVGSRLCARLRRCGREVMACDPPRVDAGLADAGAEPLHPLARLLETCSVITLHVPKTVTGPHPTHHLLDARALARLRPGALVLNTSRGSVVDAVALEAWLRSGRGFAVLDVWEHEPDLRWSLFDLPELLLATPHIADYTLEGKVASTQKVHDAVAAFVGRSPCFSTRTILGGIGARALGGSDSALALLRQVHPIEQTDATLRRLRSLSSPQRARAFEQLRRSYPLRRELSHFATPADATPEQRRLAERLGVGVAARSAPGWRAITSAGDARSACETAGPDIHAP